MTKLTDEEKAARTADGKVALSEYFADQESLHARTEKLRLQRMAKESEDAAQAVTVEKLKAAINAKVVGIKAASSKTAGTKTSGTKTSGTKTSSTKATATKRAKSTRASKH